MILEYLQKHKRPQAVQQNSYVQREFSVEIADLRKSRDSYSQQVCELNSELQRMRGTYVLSIVKLTFKLKIKC